MADMLDSFAPDVDFNAEPEAPEPEVAAPEPQLEVKEPEKVGEPKAEEHKPQKLVPVENVAAVKAQAREWKERATQIERESQERFAKLEARLQALANPPAPAPKFEDDPAGHLQHEVTATKAEIAALKQSSEQTRQIQESQAFEQQVAASTQAAEAAFASEHPDYLDAVKHLQAIANKNYEMMGMDDPVARQAQIRKDALQMSLKALQMGRSPAEMAYQLAQNYGYKAPEPKGEDAAKKIATIQAGQKTAAMPSGGTKQASLTLAALEQMDDDEFNKLVEDDTAWKKLVRQMQ